MNNEANNPPPHKSHQQNGNGHGRDRTTRTRNRNRTTSHANNNTNTLEHYGQWLLSIPRDDIPTLTQTSEYKSFIEAFQNLEQAHRKSQTIIQNQRKSQLGLQGEGGGNGGGNGGTRSVSFLQHMALDDIVLRIFEFLPCATLVRTSETCHRFHILSKRSAKQRTVHMEGHFYLQSEMKLLRAKEQIEGILPDRKPVVRVPLLGLQRRIYVTGSGDEEFNGIYFCTGSNGNGFLFSKPRDADEWTRQDMMEMERERDMEIDVNVNGDGDLDLDVNGVNRNNNVHLPAGLGHDMHMNMNMNMNIHMQRIHNMHRNIGMTEPRAANIREINDEGEETYPLLYPGRVPRCIIGKRFSNEVRYTSMCCTSVYLMLL